MTRVTMQQKLSMDCPRCGSKAGDSCRTAPHFSLRRSSRRTGSVSLSMRFPCALVEPHKERRAAYLAQQIPPSVKDRRQTARRDGSGAHPRPAAVERHPGRRANEATENRQSRCGTEAGEL